MLDLNESEKTTLLVIARNTIKTYLESGKVLKVDPQNLAPSLLANGASFVTLTKNGVLRGCIGSLLAFRPLYQDIQERAIQAATEDYRFQPVSASEFERLVIEISVLTPPIPMAYSDPEDLTRKLRPGVDGVTLSYGKSRATFLPQVWEDLTEPKEFLNHLCQKMGHIPTLWQEKPLTVETYQVIHFQEH